MRGVQVAYGERRITTDCVMQHRVTVVGKCVCVECRLLMVRGESL